MESKPTKVILCSRSVIKVQALKAVIRDIGEMDIYAKSNCKNAKTIPQPLNSGKICAKKRIQKVEQVFRLSMRKSPAEALARAFARFITRPKHSITTAIDEEVLVVSIENEIRINNTTMDEIEDNIIRNEGIFVGPNVDVEDVCQVVLKQTRLLDKEDVLAPRR